ncbi:MAG TPA: response regulator transcription factor [Candidatus Akkermansia intestinavium]|nr:response regulator transcription factor [Candidatus Akkermansia intestinavium]
MSSRCILVAEDDAPIREALRDSLEAAGYAVLTAEDGRRALELLLSSEVSLVLLDVNMPEINGFKLLRMMGRECPGTPCIILTAHGEEKERVKGLELGADDYVVKPFSVAELLARIAAVLRRYPGVSRSAEESLCFPGGHLVAEEREVLFDDGRSVALSEKEFALFRYLLAHPGRVISQGELLLRVWGQSASGSQTRTVAVTLTRLKDKIGPAAAAHIENVRGRGYRWNESPSS